MAMDGGELSVWTAQVALPSGVATEPVVSTNVVMKVPSTTSSSRTRISFTTYEEAPVRLSIYDVRGHRMRSLVAGRLRERALLLDGERVLLRAFAHVATRAPGWRGRPLLATWLLARIDEAVDGVLLEEADLALDTSALCHTGCLREQR